MPTARSAVDGFPLLPSASEADQCFKVRSKSGQSPVKVPAEPQKRAKQHGKNHRFSSGDDGDLKSRRSSLDSMHNTQTSRRVPFEKKTVGASVQKTQTCGETDRVPDDVRAGGSRSATARVTSSELPRGRKLVGVPCEREQVRRRPTSGKLLVVNTRRRSLWGQLVGEQRRGPARRALFPLSRRRARAW